MNKIDSTFEKAEPITLEKPFLQRTPPCATNAREYQRFEASDRLLDQLNKDREAKRERTREEVRKEGARKAEAQQEVAWRGRGTNATEGRQGWDREDRVTLMTWNCRGIKHTLSTVGETHTLKEMTNQLRPKVVFMQETKLRHRYRKPKLEQMQDFTDYYSSLPANRTRGGKKIDLPAYQTHNKAGVVTLIHNSLCPTQNVERMEEPRNLQGYMVGLRLHTSRGSLLLINLYIPPKGNAAADQGDTPEYGRDAVLEGVLEWTKAHRKRGEPILLGGDMNAAWAPQDRPVTRKLTNVDKEYREWTKKLGILPIDCYSQVEHPNEMRGLTYESGATDPSSGHMGSRSRIDDWLASLEGSPSLQREDFDRDGQPNYCTAHRNLAHLSDHHPLIAHLHGTNMGIRVNKDWEKDTQTNRVHTKRLKKYMTDDERKAVKDVLEETLKGDIADVTSRIRCIGETGLDVREELEGTASQIHDILKKALTTSLEEVGEDVTYTGMMRPGAGPKRRQVQEGYLREVDKRKHKNLQTTHTKLRAALRKKPKNGETSEAPQIYREMEAEIKGLNREGLEGEQEDEQWWETAARALKQTRTNIRALYKKHEHRQAWKRIKHFRDLLRGSPKAAHRYLFETGGETLARRS